RGFTLVNSQEREPREVTAEQLLELAGLFGLGDRLLLSEMQLDGEQAPLPARFQVRPLEVKVLRAVLRPARQVPIGPCEAGRAPGHHPAGRRAARLPIGIGSADNDTGRYPAHATSCVP